jgi:hypothetical protein
MDSTKYCMLVVTLYGDQISTMTAAGGCVVALAARRQWALVVRFAFLLFVAIAIEVATKMAFFTWGIQFGIASFHGMSGHTLRSFASYPSLGLILFADASHAKRMIPTAVGSLFALAVLSSIVALQEHTPVEAVAGAMLGLAIPMYFAKYQSLPGLHPGLRFAIVALVLLMGARSPRGDFDFERSIVRAVAGPNHRSVPLNCGKRVSKAVCDHGRASGAKR